MNKNENLRSSPADVTDNSEQLQEPTLAQVYQDKKQTRPQRQAIAVLDGMAITIEHKRLYFLFKLWEESGSYAPIKEFEEIPEDPTIDSLLDKVWDHPERVAEYEEFHSQLIQRRELEKGKALARIIRDGVPLEEAAGELEISLETAATIVANYEQRARQEKSTTKGGAQTEKEKITLQKRGKLFLRNHPEARKALALRKKGLSSRQISENLKISVAQTNQTVDDLLYLGLLEPDSRHRRKVEQHRRLCAKIKALRDQRVPNTIIAERLIVSVRRVNRAVQTMIRVGEISPYLHSNKMPKTAEEDDAEMETIRILRVNTDLTENQIAEALTISPDVVHYKLSLLRKQNKVPKKTEAYFREKKKEILQEAFRDILSQDPNAARSYWAIRSKYLPTSDIDTVRSLCEEIATEEPVPRIITRGKAGKQ